MNNARRNPMVVVGTALLMMVSAVSVFADDVPMYPKVEDYYTAMAEESDPGARIKLFYNLDWHIEHGNLKVDLNDSERLIQFYFDIACDPQMAHARMPAREFLVKHPHPAIADKVYELIADPAHDIGPYSLGDWLAILVRLHDSRVLPFLLEQLKTSTPNGHKGILKLMGELGDSRAIEPLEDIANDYGLGSQIEKMLLEADRKRGREPRDVSEWGEQNAEEERQNAKRAIRDIRLLQKHNIVCPFEIEDDAMEVLRRNGFVILDEPKNEMFEFYNEEYPFITTDIVFHTFMILMRAGLDEMEMLLLREEIGNFALEMMNENLHQRDRLPDPDLRLLADQNAAFFAVPAILCGVKELDEIGLPEPWSKEVEDELARIQSANTIAASRLLCYEEDYTEYKTRGRHSGKPELAGYFKGMMWLGRSYFPVDTVPTCQRSLLFLDILEHCPELLDRWANLDRLLGMFFGERDDLAFPEYMTAARAVTGIRNNNVALNILANDSLLKEFQYELNEYPSPRVNSAFLRWPMSMAWPFNTFGLRIFGQRYTRDSHIFQEILNAQVWPPSGLHVASALLGSKRAGEILEDEERTFIFEDTTAMIPPADRLAGLDEGYLYCFEPLFKPDPRAPDFMQKPAWEEKQINTSLGGWTEVRHSIALYAKAARMYMGSSMMTDRFHGYVEPYPDFYARLDSLVRRVDTLFAEFGLYERIAMDQENILNREDEKTGADQSTGEETVNRRQQRLEDARRRSEAEYQRKLQGMRLERSMLHEFSSILIHLETLARGELEGRPQSVDDGLFLKGLGRRLRHLSFNRSSMNIAPAPMSLVIDVATEYLAGECLEIGVGRPWPIYIMVPDEERHFICRGAVYSYYEFTQPVANRLDDTQWRNDSTIFNNPAVKPWLATRPTVFPVGF